MLSLGLHGVPDPTGRGMSHDHGLALMHAGRVVQALELERHTGRKHDGNLADHVEELLAPWLAGSESVQVGLVNSFSGCDLASSGGGLVVEGAPDLEVDQGVAACSGHLRLHGRQLNARFFTVCHELAPLGT